MRMFFHFFMCNVMPPHLPSPLHHLTLCYIPQLKLAQGHLFRHQLFLSIAKRFFVLHRLSDQNIQAFQQIKLTLPYVYFHLPIYIYFLNHNVKALPLDHQPAALLNSVNNKKAILSQMALQLFIRPFYYLLSRCISAAESGRL